jgi:vancomycin permeability regulator SanA
VIWTFTLTADATYALGQVPQLLLSGDADTVIV